MTHRNKTKKIGSPRGARAKWGQNFLRDKGILKKIAIFAQIEKEDAVVEVGPGEGTLTEFLLERAKKVIAIEKDEKLAKLLEEKFKIQISNGKLEIIEGDILKMPKGVFEMPRSQKTPLGVFENYILVGNIPYYITGAIFKKFLEAENKPKSITFVVQKEVAERIMARDGKESILSISIKAYGTPEYGGTIKAGSFYPKPKVDSAIIAVRNIDKIRKAEQKSSCSESPRISSLHSARLSSQDFFARPPDNFEQKFFEILKAGFAHKRKLLIKNLLNMSRTRLDSFKSLNSSQIEVSRRVLDTFGLKEVFGKCGISEKARAEDLKVEDWICLAKNLL